MDQRINSHVASAETPDRQRHAQRLKALRATVYEARRVLRENPLPDTFLGRKTFDPFPMENESGERRTTSPDRDHGD